MESSLNPASKLIIIIRTPGFRPARIRLPIRPAARVRVSSRFPLTTLPDIAVANPIPPRDCRRPTVPAAHGYRHPAQRLEWIPGNGQNLGLADEADLCLLVSVRRGAKARREDVQAEGVVEAFGQWEVDLAVSAIVHGDYDRTRGPDLCGRKAHADSAILSLDIMLDLHTHQVLSPRSSHYPCPASGP